MRLHPEGGVTIKSHHGFTTPKVTQRSKPEWISHSQLYISVTQLSWSDLLSTALFRKYVEVAFPPKETSLRRRIESQTTNVIRMTANKSLNPCQDTIDQAMFLCEQENERSWVRGRYLKRPAYGPA